LVASACVGSSHVRRWVPFDFRLGCRWCDEGLGGFVKISGRLGLLRDDGHFLK
jgi:hypothetical protein